MNRPRYLHFYPSYLPEDYARNYTFKENIVQKLGNYIKFTQRQEKRADLRFAGDVNQIFYLK